jgi:hypothetical protein
MRPALSLLILVAGLAASFHDVVEAAETRSIAGEWRIAHDPDGVGERDRWFERDLPGTGTVALPGLIGVADRPEAARGTGPVWLQYSLMIPGSWKGKRIALVLERATGATRAWVDGQELAGPEDSLVAPHVHPLGALGKPATSRLTIRLAESPDGWNGLIGGLEIRAVDPLAIDDLQVYPDLDRKSARVRVTVTNTTDRELVAKLRFEVRPRPGGPLVASGETTLPVLREGIGEHELPLGAGAKPWTTEAPVVCLLKASVSGEIQGQPLNDERAVRFGLRTIADGEEGLLLNGRALAKRSIDGWARPAGGGCRPIMPGEWRGLFRGLRARGVNLASFGEWCPPEAAFAAADAEGLLLSVGTGPVEHETEVGRMLREYGNHPSFGVVSVRRLRGESPDQLGQRLDRLRRQDPRPLFSAPP